MDEDAGPRLSRLRAVLPWLVEAAYVTDVMIVALALFIMAVSGKDPFHSAAGVVVAGVCLVGLVVHRLWVRRYRDQTSISVARHVARERRGF